MGTKTEGEGLNVTKYDKIRRGKKEKREGATEASTAAASHILAMRCED